MRATSVGWSMTAVLCYAIVCGTPRFAFSQGEETLLRIEGESVRPLALSGAALAQLPRTVVQVRDRDGTVSAYARVLLRDVLALASVPLGERGTRSKCALGERTCTAVPVKGVLHSTEEHSHGPDVSLL